MTEETTNAKRIVATIAQNPDQIGRGYSTEDILFIIEPGGFHTSFVAISYFKKNHPEAYETLQAHRALKKLKNSGG